MNVVATIVGLLFGAVQALSLYILTDLRSRVVRVEDRMFGVKQ